MNKICMKLIVGISLFSSAFASDVGERIQAGSRAQMPEQAIEKEQILKETFSALSEAPKASFQAGFAVTEHSGAFHNPVSVTLLGDSVMLEDGSTWSVSVEDWYKALNWYTTDLVVLSPHEWSTYLHPYRMTNQNTGESIQVSLTLGPIYAGLYTYWITSTSYWFSNAATLNDGSTWTMDDYDSNYNNVSRTWMPNDTIIIGVNDGLYASIYPNILINVNTNTWVRARVSW